MRVTALVAIAGCAHGAAGSAPAPLRMACGAGQRWNGAACQAAGDAPARVAEGARALAELEVDKARASLDAAEQAGPLDHATHVALWEQRGIAAAYVDDEAAATRAFDMLLALDPGHFLSYELSPKATLVFEKVRKQAQAAPALDVSWSRGGKVGEPVPLDVEVLADPKRFLRRATVFVRARGETSWRAADLALDAASDRRVVLPAVRATRAVSLELYLRAYDERGNEVLAWADPSKPREIALRYEPPTPWYRTWWGITSIVGAGAAITAGIVYAVTLAPPDKIDGGVTVAR